jgi:hypothetical protein
MLLRGNKLILGQKLRRQFNGVLEIEPAELARRTYPSAKPQGLRPVAALRKSTRVIVDKSELPAAGFSRNLVNRLTNRVRGHQFYFNMSSAVPKLISSLSSDAMALLEFIRYFNCI